jgi:poly(A) polymerase
LARDLAVLAWAEARARGEADDRGFRRLLAAADCWRPVVFPLKGADVLAIGVPPGPDVGRLLAQVEDWWIDQGFAPDRDQCLAKLCELSRTVLEAS